jgi:hypothetical protein
MLKKGFTPVTIRQLLAFNRALVKIYTIITIIIISRITDNIERINEMHAYDKKINPLINLVWCLSEDVWTSKIKYQNQHAHVNTQISLTRLSLHTTPVEKI